MKIVFAVFVLGIAGSVSGQIDDDRNAATWYRKAIERVQELDLSREELEPLWNYGETPADTPAPEDVRQLLGRLQPVLRDLKRGARQRHSDFGNLSRDIDTLDKHVGPLSRLTWLVGVEAKVRLNDGDVAGAMRGITDLYRVAGHLTEDHRTFSSLMAQGVFRNADRFTADAIDRGALGAEDAAKIARAMAPFVQADAFNLVPALQIEKEMLTAWAHDLYAKRDNLDQLILDLENSLGVDPETLMESSALLDPDLFDASLERMEDAMDRAIELFQQDDRDEATFELGQLVDEIEKGDHGPLAALLSDYMPQDGTLRRTALVEERIAKRHALLQAIARGEVDPKSLINAAIYYRQAMAKLRSTDPCTRESWVMIAAQSHDEPLTPEQIEAVDRAAEIVALVREGASKTRCVFTDEFTTNPPLAIPEYLPGMYELAIVLLADTVRALQLADTSNASANLLAAVGMARHLSADGAIVGSMIAHVSLVEMTPHLELALTDQEFTWKQRTDLRDAVGALPQHDPFAYRRAVRAARAVIADGMAERWNPNRLTQSAADQFAQQLLVDVVFHGRMLMSDRYFWEPDLDRWVSPTAQIRELFDVEALEAVFTWLAAHRAKLQQRDTAVVRDRLQADEPVVLLPLAERMAAAETDLAAIRELLADPSKQ